MLVYAEILVLRGEFIKSRFEISAALGQIGSAFVVLSQARPGGDERPEWFLRIGNGVLWREPEIRLVRVGGLA